MSLQLFNEISKLATEEVSSDFQDIDLLESEDLIRKINEEDKKVALAVEKEIPYIAKAVDYISAAFLNGGRLIYVGAGTSGRLGIVDSSECPPTFSADPEMVQAIIAGGIGAIFKAVEGAEDSFEQGAQAIIDKNLNKNDVVCGIAASGRTPFVLGALKEANDNGIITILITTNDRKQVLEKAPFLNVLIAPQVGTELIAGSTRMKSGTAQKMVLNMLTSASMIKIGKTYGNTMIDLALSNKKLEERAKGILMRIAKIDYKQAEINLLEANGKVKLALFKLLSNSDLIIAEKYLNETNGNLKKALILYNNK